MSDELGSLNKRIGARRIQLGLSETTVARRARLTIHEYWDVEHRPHEILRVVRLYHVKRLFDALELDLLDFLGLPRVESEGGTLAAGELQSRSAIIANQRKGMGLSLEELGDRVGFTEEEIAHLETYTAHLESWVIENILRLAEVLQLPAAVLLDV